MTQRRDALLRRHREHAGRGGCGVGAIVDFRGPSPEVVRLALSAISCMEHRGGAIDDTGDGAGLLLRTDERFFRRFIAPGRRLPEGQRLVVGVIFFPLGESANLPPFQSDIDATLRQHGLSPLGWRHVPVDESVLGRRARAARRDIWQVLLGEGMVAEEDLPRALFAVKAHIERAFRDVYVVSLSPRTMVYKALATGEQLRRFYPDLAGTGATGDAGGEPALSSDLAVFHRRYSTNTFSNWYLAQPFRLLGHNGEINTIKANRNTVRDLEAELGLPGLLMNQGSDSADLDRVVELFVSHGVSLPEALMRMLPLAWADLPQVTPEVVRFYQGVGRALGTLGAWEGPAALVASDGVHLVGLLDRMGLRPLRWIRSRHRLVLGSELGAVDFAAEDILETGQLDPGEGIAVDLASGRICSPLELVTEVVARTSINFAELAERGLIPLPQRRGIAAATRSSKPDQRALNLFGWTPDRVRTVKAMAESGKEPITSMGFDRPLAVLSPMRPPLAKYFKQIVAVVTNPPIDPLREGSAFDLTVHLGRHPDAREEAPDYAPQPQYRIGSPFLTGDQYLRIRDGEGDKSPRAETLDCTFVLPAPSLPTGERDGDDGDGDGDHHAARETVSEAGGRLLARSIAEIARKALALVRTGRASILLLSDRAALGPPSFPTTEAAPRRLPLPMLLVVAAVHNALTGDGQRRHASLVCETGEVQEGHDAALLFGAGADAVYPHLLLDLGGLGGLGDADSGPRLVAALDSALLRVMSKMGITTFDGYRGSRLFEAVGVAPAVVEYYLPGITSRLGGITLDDLCDDLRFREALGAAPHTNTEVSVYRKEVWQALQEASRGNEGAWDRFRGLVDATPPVYLRDLLRFADGAAAARSVLSLSDVVPVERIIEACFRGAAMSHGALHRTAHRAIAAAFNEFGAATNCGEGGEDPRRDRGGPWEADRSRIRQLGSARFGVDARYLASADELQIKIGQGAKPGEGGMLPAAKVTAEIALIRRTQVGVTLISPPPHHDLYSIEDLAQLIYSCKQANPAARVSVKIPAVTDVGTIAVGIAKAGADTIDVSGFEGGTGAAASSSIEHAGLPLERGLSETHQALVVSGVRGRVRLRADGGLKTGRDVAIALALGADEVSLGTALMIAEQCIFCHGCSKGNCPAGITTASDLVARRLMTDKKGRSADEQLRDVEQERYLDARQAVTRYLRALGGELRALLATLGLRHPAELTGRVDLLERVEHVGSMADGDPRRDRIARIDLSELLVDMVDMADMAATTDSTVAATAGDARPPVDPTSTMNRRIVEAIAAGQSALALPITSADRAVAATAAGHLAGGRLIIPDGGFVLRLRGTAGQALGFALTDGLRIELEGYANDSVGEAMSGGEIVVRQPRPVAAEVRARASCIGNSACYGATGGRLYVEGRAGQRLGVRNSAATIVTLGAGKYAFEYMTGGLGVVLGPVGPVVGSGMTGGALYILDEDHTLERRLHTESVQLAESITPDERATLHALISDFTEKTQSERARSLLDAWPSTVEQIKKITPRPTT